HMGVLYAGRLVEIGPAAETFANPRHPYTRALLAASPGLTRRGMSAAPPPEPPDPLHPGPGGCFAPRWPMADSACRTVEPTLAVGGGGNRLAACSHSGAIAPLAMADFGLTAPAFGRRLALLRSRPPRPDSCPGRTSASRSRSAATASATASNGNPGQQC